MTIKQKDIKLLWGRAASRCSICNCELAYDASAGQISIGEQAHIVAEEDAGPRGKSILSAEERNSYFNLILLCPTHHTVIDRAVEDYPIERLHLLKDEHELMVRERLTGEEPEEWSALVYARIIDLAVEACRLSTWEGWTARAAGPEHVWEVGADRPTFDLYRATQRALWPGRLPELEAACLALPRVMLAAFNVFAEHARPSGDTLRADRFYHDGPRDSYHARLAEFESWSRCCDELLREATRVANWFAALVRRDVNPSFFLLEGRFGMVEQVGLAYESNVYEFTPDELKSLPDSLEERLERIGLPYLEHKKQRCEATPSIPPGG